MKQFRFTFLLVASLFSVSAFAQTADEVIAKHIDALGGAAKLATLKSVRMESNLSVQGMDIPVVTTKVHNVGQRVDISAMGMDGYIITTATKGWTYMPFMGQSAPEAMPEEQVKEGADELDLNGPLFNYKEKGSTVELLGKEDIDGTSTFKIKLTTKAGKSRTYFLDAKTFFIIRMTAKATVMGQEQEMTVNYGDYKAVDGVFFAHTIGGAFGQGDMTVTKIEINKPIDEKIFTVGS